jgi:hypothetical protein
MSMMTIAVDVDDVQFEPGQIPPSAALVMSALEAGRHSRQERRVARRYPYRVATQFRLFSEEASGNPRLLFTRDVNRRSLGFVTMHRLPLGYGGVVDLPDDDGKLIGVHCTLLRCREAVPGWFEGAVYFNREQPQFDR